MARTDGAIMSAKQIALLKKQLKSQYRHMQSVQPGYGCGSTLMKYINVDYSEACAVVNATLDELAAIDPATPTTRF